MANKGAATKVTICQGPTCGRAITYKTKPPKLCDVCKAKTGALKGKAAPRRGRKSIPQRSKKELEVQRVMAQILPDAEYITNGYYSWLESPKGHPMQLDMFFPELKLVLEVDGRQHYQYSPYMHSSVEAFEYLQACDALKDKLCAKRGLTVVRIKYDRKISKGYLLRRLHNDGILDHLKRLTRVDETVSEGGSK